MRQGEDTLRLTWGAVASPGALQPAGTKKSAEKPWHWLPGCARDAPHLRGLQNWKPAPGA